MQNIEQLDFFKDNPIRSFINSGFCKYKPGFSWTRDYPHDSLYIISDGCLKFSLNGKEFTAEKNDVVYLSVKDKAVVSNVSDKSADLYFVAFIPNSEVNLNINMLYRETNHLKLFKDINDAYLSKAPLSSLKIAQLFIKLLYALASENIYSSEEYQQHSKIHKAARYINVHYYKDISIDDLCDMTGYSPAHLRRLFKKVFGTSPCNYISDRRIERAKEMLLEPPSKTIDEIAEMLGICSPSYFCRMFKDKVGVSPIEYKKANS